MSRVFFSLCCNLQRLAKREDGQSIVEYSLVVALVFMAAIASLGTIGSKVSSIFAHSANVI